MIDYEKSAKLNNTTVEKLKMWFNKYPNSSKLIIRICSKCKKSYDKVRYNQRNKLCKICGNQKIDLPIDKIISEYESGMNTNEIGIIYGCSGNTILNHLRKENVKIRPLGNKKQKRLSLTQENIKKLFDYKDGYLYRKFNCRGNSTLIKCDNNGDRDRYLMVSVSNKPYLAHRIIFLWHHGYLPDMIDHIDRNKRNNHIENLRESTLSENNINKVKIKLMKGNEPSSQYKGVSWEKDRNKWRVRIMKDGKRFHLGRFISEIDAAKAYNIAVIDLYGDFAVLNIINE